MLEIRNKHFLHQDYLFLLNAEAGWGSQKAVTTALQKNWVFYLLKVLEILCCVGKKPKQWISKWQKTSLVLGSRRILFGCSLLFWYMKRSPHFVWNMETKEKNCLGPSSTIALWQEMINRYRKIISNINTRKNWLDETQILPVKIFKRSIILYLDLSVFPPSM